MEPSTLKGFCEAVRCLGISIAAPEEFLKEQQDAVFAWAKDQEFPRQVAR